ncbi:UbiA prenyltransferase family-domain-containing protein [Daedaleopsis nitida]|nr:UbiA prenyltransferase family-domain-containing protein [Daedaleopsis nitida]
MHTISHINGLWTHSLQLFPTSRPILPMSGSPFRIPWVPVTLVASMGNPLYTLYLFTRSDLKTILLPCTIFGTMAAPPHTAHLLLVRIIWIWLHLLQVDVANQSLRPDEDEVNKPWRPIPSSRITRSSARALRWTLLPTCLALSFILRVPMAGGVLCIANLLYHELALDGFWLTKNLCNAVGYACFNAGASRVLCDSTLGIPGTALYAQVFNALIILTTIHVQDFQDVEGDRVTGRSTLPSVYPIASRVSVVVLLPMWSFLVSQFWSVGTITTCSVVGLGLYVGLQFLLNAKKSREHDHMTYRKYNVWLAIIHTLPFIYSRFD